MQEKDVLAADVAVSLLEYLGDHNWGMLPSRDVCSGWCTRLMHAKDDLLSEIDTEALGVAQVLEV